MSEYNKKKTVVHLRIFKGKPGLVEIARNGAGKVLNDNHRVSLIHGTFEWDNFLKRIRTLSAIEAVVEKVFVQKSESKTKKVKEGEEIVAEFTKAVWDEIEIPQSIVDEVNKAMNPVKEVLLTPEQDEIRKLQNENLELHKKMDAILSSQDKPTMSAAPEKKKPGRKPKAQG